MDFLNPHKKRAHHIRLLIGYLLVAVALAMGTLILVLLSYGYDYDRKTGEVIQNSIVFVSAQPASADIYINGQRQSVNAMAMALPAGKGQVHVVWGMGSISRCLLDDASFELLFHSLRPAGWTSDGGKSLNRTLTGTWRYTASAGLQQLTFKDDGSYERDLGSRATVGVSERTSSTASGGRFKLEGGELVLTPSHRPQSPDRYRVRAYEEWFLGGWKPAIALLDRAASPPLVVPYYRVDEP